MALDAKDGTKAVLRLKRVSCPGQRKKRKMDLKGSCECLYKLVFFFLLFTEPFLTLRMCDDHKQIVAMTSDTENQLRMYIPAMVN